MKTQQLNVDVRTTFINTSNELSIYRFENGFKLISDSEAKKIKFSALHHDTGHTVASLFQLPICVYLSNTTSAGENMNEATIEACGFDSLKNARGKTLHEVFSHESANLIIKSDKEVMKFNQLKITENDCLRKDDFFFQTLSIKSPWYDIDNKIVGLLGFTIIIGKQPLAESITKISQLGLLVATKNLPSNNIYFSKREIECLRLTVRGKTAKQAAFMMGISQRTVEEYLTNIKAKLGVYSKAELIEKVIDQFI